MHDSSFRHAAAPGVCRVLVAAGDQRMRAALRALLEAEGHYLVVAEARSGEEAAALDRSLRPELILLDLLFPTAPDGLDTLRLLASENTRPVVVISARTALRQAALAAGAAGFVVQGEGADLLLAALAAAIAQAPPASS